MHSVGGWAALAGVIVLGPRAGKYVNGKIKAIAGHNMPLATIGVFLLWLGWFGFNGGSVLSADPELVSLVFVTTCLAAASGVIGAMAASWIGQKKPDLSMVLNGSLAGLVGITAGADAVSVNAAMVIGFIAGVIVVGAVLLIDRARLDDPVGAISVHLVCGIWGTLAVGIFSASHSIAIQALGVLAYGLIAFPAALLLFLGLKYTVGLRVSEKEEAMGLDVGEHGMEAYGGFHAMVGAVLLIDRARLDDPVGAISVHLVCGIWGTLAVGIFSASHSIAIQALGVLAYGLIAFPAALLLFLGLKYTVGLRVSEKEEAMGLDVGEHGMEAYGGFQIFTTQ